ncbi:hypothetical protein CA85_22200 [Allorhodopirellula solitaria]|uniref:Uncharacterized protein n=1 Tax=Allorhodopirellula solitaria TaxID=2527987 RepID=A0A5C5XWP7_9BACT|nr:hypothetical protein CA85_22200 [Allorhodopirellula solitaria]
MTTPVTITRTDAGFILDRVPLRHVTASKPAQW